MLTLKERSHQEHIPLSDAYIDVKTFQERLINFFLTFLCFLCKIKFFKPARY